MAKKDLSKAVESIMPTMNALESKSKEKFEQEYKKRNKGNSDYIRLDLRPNGKDLKGYVESQARKQSAKQGRTISATKYIQELIENDMNKHRKGVNTREETVNTLLALEDSQFNVVKSVIRELTK